MANGAAQLCARGHGTSQSPNTLEGVLPPRGKEGNCQGSGLSHWTHISIKTFIQYFPSAKHYAKSFAYFAILDPHDSPMRSKCHMSHCTDEKRTDEGSEKQSDIPKVTQQASSSA